jgi:hypothetical protein
MPTPEIQRIESDVFDPAGGDRAYVLGRNLGGTTEVRVGTALATGVVVWGDAATFNGTNSVLQMPNLNVMYGTTAYSGWALVYVPSARVNLSPDYDNDTIIASTPSAYWTLTVKSDGTLTLRHFDGAGTAQLAITSLPLGQLSLVQWKFDNVNVKLRVNGGARVVTPCVGVGWGAGVAVRAGVDIGGTRFLGGTIQEIGVANVTLSDANEDSVAAYVNQTYGTTFGGIPASNFDPTTLALTGYWRAGGYVSGTWTGVASAGTSGGRNLTEATNPPAVAAGVGLKLTVVPANAAGRYPLTIKNASGRTTLPNAVEMANPKTIPNCVWWLRPDAAVITQAAGVVTAWSDQSGVGDAGRNVTPPGTDKPAYNATDAAYNGKPTVGSFNVAGANNDTRLASAAWSTTYGLVTIGVVGHTAETSNRYFTFQSVAQYNAVLNGSGTPVAYGGNATTTFQNTLGKTLSIPRAVVSVVFNGAASKYAVEDTTVTGTTDANILGATAVNVGSYPAAATSFGVERIAEIFAHSRALTSREQRTIRRYRDSYYGKAA